MDLSKLQPPKGRVRSKKRVGRGQGSGHGKTAGRGHKGAKSRSGFSRKRGFEGGQMPLHRRLPKRGFHNPFRVDYDVVNLDTLTERFESGTEVTLDLLRERGLIRGGKRRVKVLARGEVTKAFTVHAHRFSGKAAQKIEASGGRAVLLESSPRTATES
ncbi:MAG: 50S ribosomal protein L15 [Acidobacteria bacterium]|nr:50S ribosomal protein L15 [Acidobacteriota bacterium]